MATKAKQNIPDEISSASLARSVTLSGVVRLTKAKAVLTDGMLKITLPKLEASRQHDISVE